MRRSRAAARSPCLAVALVNSISAIWRFSPWPRALRRRATRAVASPAGPARRLPSEARCRDPAGFWFRPVCVRYRPGPCAPSPCPLPGRVCEILDGALRLQQLRQRLAHLHVQLGGVQGVQELIALHPLSHRDPLVLDGAVEGALTVRVMSASSRPTRPRRRVSGSGRTRCQCVPGAVAGAGRQGDQAAKASAQSAAAAAPIAAVRRQSNRDLVIECDIPALQRHAQPLIQFRLRIQITNQGVQPRIFGIAQVGFKAEHLKVAGAARLELLAFKLQFLSRQVACAPAISYWRQRDRTSRIAFATSRSSCCCASLMRTAWCPR